VGVGQVGGPRPGRDSDDREDGSIDLLNLADARTGYTLVAHIGD
jgi:hypothetical protein